MTTNNDPYIIRDSTARQFKIVHPKHYKFIPAAEPAAHSSQEQPMQAYYCPILFEHNAGHDTAGFIYQDEDNSLIKIVPEHATNINASVKLDGQDIVTLLQLALPILSPQQVEEVAAALKPLQEAFKEEA